MKTYKYSLTSLVKLVKILDSRSALIMAVNPGLFKPSGKETKCLPHAMYLTYCILNITWEDKIPNITLLKRAEISSMSMLKQRCLHWLGHIVMMENDNILKEILYGELLHGKHPTGRPQLCFKDVCKRDMMACWIGLAASCTTRPIKV